MSATNLTIDIEKAFPGVDGNPTYASTNEIYMNAGEIIPPYSGLEVHYRVSGQLTSGGSPVPNKIITVTYDGYTFAVLLTDSNGEYETERGIIRTPGPYTMTATFAGDGSYLTSSANKNFTLKLIPTSITANLPTNFPENQHMVAKGKVIVNWPEWFYDGKPVEDMDVELILNNLTTVDTDTTDANGKFKTTYLWTSSGLDNIQVEGQDTTIYEGSNSGTVTIGIRDHWYPQPEEVETDCYAWVLCVDPNGIRAGPMYYILDDATVKPGITDKVGTFAGQLNDNRKVRESDSFVQYDMYLLGENKYFILDQDEFWIGLQRGPVSKRYDPENHSWAPSGGTDGKGSGIHWLMGGYISKRYYTRAAKGRVNAILLGKCYLDVWKDQLFGTDQIPRDYAEPTSLDVIANDVLADVNAQQTDDYKYTTHPVYWQTPTAQVIVNVSYGDTVIVVDDVSIFTIGDVIRISDANGSEDLQITGITDTAYLQQLDVQSYPTVDPTNPGIQNITGYDSDTATVSLRNGLMSITWQKEYVDENSFDIMQEMCQEAIYEFRINYLKQVMFYSKSTPPEATNTDIRYNTNIRHVPEIVMGDTENVITDVLVRDGLPATRPSNPDLWCSVPDYWYEIGNSGLRAYGYVLGPAPPNPVIEAYTDSSLIFDDESRPALCFQHEGLQPDFLLHLGYRLADSALGGGATVLSANMDLDLRTYRRLKFKWRHLTWNGVKPNHVTYAITDNVYAVQLHTTLNDKFMYYFGEGTQITLGHSKNDLIEATPSTVGIPQDTGYKLIDLLLPEPDDEGGINLSDVDDMKGWTYVGNPDPVEINWISFAVRLPETPPNSGYAKGSGYKTLVTVSPSAGANHVQVDNPENLAGFQSGAQTNEVILRRPIDAEIDGEGVQIGVIHPRSAPTSENIRLNAPLISGKSTGDPLRVLAGKTFCFSQLRFERDFQGIGDNASTLGPRRYRLYQEEQFDFKSQADSKVEEILNVEGVARKWVKVSIDGDPEKEVGTRVQIYLDPTYGYVFQNVGMLIDDIQYTLETVDLELILTLTPLNISPKAREVDEFNVADRTNLDSRRRNNRGRKNFIERGGGAGVR